MDQELIILVIPIAIVYLNTEPSVLRTIETIYIWCGCFKSTLFVYVDHLLWTFCVLCTTVAAWCKWKLVNGQCFLSAGGKSVNTDVAYKYVCVYKFKWPCGALRCGSSMHTTCLYLWSGDPRYVIVAVEHNCRQSLTLCTKSAPHWQKRVRHLVITHESISLFLFQYCKRLCVNPDLCYILYGHMMRRT